MNVNWSVLNDESDNDISIWNSANIHLHRRFKSREIIANNGHDPIHSGTIGMMSAAIMIAYENLMVIC